MIALSPECFPCFLRQADLAARAHGASGSGRKAVGDRVAGILSDVPPGEVPARVATRLHEIVRGLPEHIENERPWSADDVQIISHIAAEELVVGRRD